MALRPQQVQARFMPCPLRNDLRAILGGELPVDRARRLMASMVSVGIGRRQLSSTCKEEVVAVVYVDRFGEQLAHTQRRPALIQACVDMFGAALADSQQRSGCWSAAAVAGDAVADRRQRLAK